MELLLISMVAFLASLITLFSGFGLGTLLMPVIALFFSLEVAIGMTAIVHLANNLFKVVILGQFANKDVLFKFGLPAVFAAFLGAWLLGLLVVKNQTFSYSFLGFARQTNGLNILVGGLILIFVILDLSKAFKAIKLGPQFLSLGGLISGFFGGLSGHQGAFRSMFLLKAGLTKEGFIATGVMVAVMVDVTRLLVYGKDLAVSYREIDWLLVTTASLAAFLGAYMGKQFLQKTTIRFVRLLVSVMLLVVAMGLITGLL